MKNQEEYMKKNKQKQILVAVFSVIFLCGIISFQTLAEEEDFLQDTQVQKAEEEQTIISEKNSEKPLKQEKNVHKTEIKDFKQESFLTFGEEVAKLISSYDSEIDGDKIASEAVDSYTTRRLIVKSLGEDLDLSSCGADIVLNGPEQVYILQFSTEETMRQAKLQIEQMNGVKYCEIDEYDYLENPEKGKLTEGETDKVARQQDSLSWGTSHIAADQYARHLETNQNEIIVAVIDTGIDTTHPFFNGRLSMDAAYNYVNASTDVEDDHGHGTHMSGIVVDTTPNLNIKILPIKCMDSRGIGTATNIANAIRRAADAGAKVINYSAVGVHTQYKDDAIKYAIEKGVTVVVAAGNGGQDINESFICPSHLEECIIVGSIDSAENRAKDSNYGETLDLMAPGIDINSTYLRGSYASFSGTSMATPYVSGAAAMLKLSNPSLTPAQIEELLKENAKDLGEVGRDAYYGYGMIDMSNLIVHNKVKDEAIEPTCEQAGVTEGSHCSICGKVLVEQEELPKLAHQYEEKIIKATPTKDGERKWICSKCGDMGESETIYYPQTVNLSQTEYVYTGMPKKPTAQVIDSNGNLIDASNYTISYQRGRIETGTYTITIKFKGDLYSGSIPREIYINKGTQKFSGGGCTKRIGDSAFTLTSVKRTKGDGTLSYKSSNKKVAIVSNTGKITIKGVGKTTITLTAAETKNYKKATKNITVTVKPTAMNMNSLKSNKKGSFTATWTKNKAITAYQLQYSTKSDFSQATTKTISGYTATSKTVYQLKSGKKYYVRFRVYKTVDGVKYYSLWSNTKTVTTKKK